MNSQLSHDSRIYISGHLGLAGSAIWRELVSCGYSNLVGFSSREVNLTQLSEVNKVFLRYLPEAVIMAAAKVGGIMANSKFPVNFLEENLAIQFNTFRAAHETRVNRLLFLGSSCIYPRNARQPINESELLNGPLEETNEAYAIAKLSGIFTVKAYRKQFGYSWISAMPTNLYGAGDNFDETSSHVLPALIRRFYDAKVKGLPCVSVWGSGKPRREFLHVDDLARACHVLLDHYDSDEPINIGYGEDISIAELATLIADIVGYKGEIRFDVTKPDGVFRKLLDSSKLRALGWKPKVSLREGIFETFEWFKVNQK